MILTFNDLHRDRELSPHTCEKSLVISLDVALLALTPQSLHSYVFGAIFLWYRNCHWPMATHNLCNQMHLPFESTFLLRPVQHEVLNDLSNQVALYCALSIFTCA